MSTIFSQVIVYVNPADTRRIEWRLYPSYSPAGGTYNAYVEYAVRGNTYTRLNPAAPVVDGYYYNDVTTKIYNKTRDIMYRVVIVDSGTTYTSQGITLGDYLSQADYGIAKEVLRSNLLALTRTHRGSYGYLRRRKESGTACTACVDTYSGGVVDTLCSACYGTRIVGGFYASEAYWVEKVAPLDKNMKDIKPPIGILDERGFAGKCIAYPVLMPGDLWIEDGTNKRFVVKGLETAVAIRNVPLIYQAMFAEITPTDILYTLSVS